MFCVANDSSCIHDRYVDVVDGSDDDGDDAFDRGYQFQLADQTVHRFDNFRHHDIDGFDKNDAGVSVVVPAVAAAVVDGAGDVQPYNLSHRRYCRLRPIYNCVASGWRN